MPIAPILIMLLLAIITHFVLAYTKLGMMAYAIGGNEEASWLSGIATGRNKIMIMGGALSGVGGLLLASHSTWPCRP